MAFGSGSYLMKWENSRLTALRSCLFRNRRKGYTTAALRTAREMDAIFVCGSVDHSHCLPNDVEKVSIDSLERTLSKNKPLVVDNYALEQVFRETDVLVRNLIEENKELRRTAMRNPTDLTQLAAWYRSL